MDLTNDVTDFIEPILNKALFHIKSCDHEIMSHPLPGLSVQSNGLLRDVAWPQGG